MTRETQALQFTNKKLQSSGREGRSSLTQPLEEADPSLTKPLEVHGRGHRELSFEVDTILRSIVPTIVDIDIEIDISIILSKDSPNYSLGWHVGNST